MPDMLFSDTSLTEWQQALSHAAETVERAAGSRTSAVAPHDVTALTERVDSIDLDRPTHDLAQSLQELREVYLEHAVWFHDPTYLAHLNCPVTLSSLAAEVITSSVNSSLDTWDQSAAGTLMERHLLSWTARRLGWDDGSSGVFTSGGSQSNLHALLLARGDVCARVARTRGIDDVPSHVLPRLRVLATPESHFSIGKAAGLLGLGSEAVVTVATDRRGRMRTEALDRAVTDLLAAGHLPMAVVATAGTTDRGCIDPLPEIAEVCRRQQVWMHVDAAVGGGLVTSGRLRTWLDGVELADSVTVDYHKTFFVPIGASALLVRDQETLRHARSHADYLNPADSELPNQVDTHLATTRRFDALKVWLTLRTDGADRVGALLEQCLERADDAWRATQATPSLRAYERPQLMMLLFRVEPPEVEDEAVLDELNEAVRQDLFRTGRAAVASTTRDGRRWLKLTLLNPLTTAEQVADVLHEVAEHGCLLAARWGLAQQEGVA